MDSAPRPEGLQAGDFGIRLGSPARRFARNEIEGLAESDVRDALDQFDPLWSELFPAEQARIVQLLVERVDVFDGSLDIRLRLEGFGVLVGEMARVQPEKGGMTSSTHPTTNDRTLTVRVSLNLKRRGGRKLVMAPAGEPAWAPPRTRVVNALIKALARAHRWKRMLESGEFATVQDLADAEKINPSYVARILRLTLLAPDLVEAILDGRQAAGLQLEDLLTPFPVEWERQREALRLTA